MEAELREELETLRNRIDQLEKDTKVLNTELEERIGRDIIEGKFKTLLISNRGEFAKFGDSSVSSHTRNVGVSGAEQQIMIFSTGKTSGTQTNNSKDTDITIQHTDTGDESFMFGFRPPLYTNTGKSVTSGGSTLSDSSFTWATDELAGAQVIILNSSGVFQFTRQIASNTSSQITIDGTWPSSVSGCTYLVFMPVYLGGAQFPWRQGYFGGQDVSSSGDGGQRRVLRFGYGTTAGADVISVYFGTGSPESVVAANRGSLYLRTDGSTSTTLYVKTSGTGNTGWTAK